MPAAGRTLRDWKELRTGYWPTDLANASALLYERCTIIVADVREFPGHIACDARSRSEAAAPLLKRGEVWGVLDLDSPAKNRFLMEEGRLLEDFCRLLLEPWDEAPWRAGAG